MEDATVNLFSYAEERMLAKGAVRRPVPVLLVSGSLGAGKTTLVNHILQNKLNLNITCLVNDLASINVDADMLVHTDAARKTVRLSNGCACHSLSGELEEEMWTVLQEVDGADRVDYVVIETSGVADPARLVQSLERRHGKMTRARLDAVVVVVDADLLAHQLAAVDADRGDGAAADDDEAEAERRARARLVAACGEASWRQLACADSILLNKLDLLDTCQAEHPVASHVRGAVPWATVLTCVRGEVPLAQLLAVHRAASLSLHRQPLHSLCRAPFTHFAEPLHSLRRQPLHSLRRATSLTSPTATSLGSPSAGRLCL